MAQYHSFYGHFCLDISNCNFEKCPTNGEINPTPRTMTTLPSYMSYNMSQTSM